MTVAAAPPGLAIVDLGADATVLEAAARVAATQPGQDVALVVATGAPIARNAVFLDVLKRRAKDRRLVFVSSDARARSLAASVHLRAFASLAALERHELDSTERLGEARRAALATIAAVGPRGGMSFGRGLAVFAALVAAGAILMAVVAPQATVVVAPATSPVGPYEYDLRAGPNGDITDAQTQRGDVTTKFSATATGSRLKEVRAVGVEQFSNTTTNDIRVAKGTIVQTSDGIRFQTTEDKTLPKSGLFPILFISRLTISIEAVDTGPRGNVAANKITRSPTTDYTVTNLVETLGGESKKIWMVTQTDYDNAVKNGDAELQKAGDALVPNWQKQATNRTVYGTVVKRTTITPASDVVGKDAGEEPAVGSFELTVSGTATAYSVPSAEPRATALNRLGKEVPDKAIDMGSAAKVDLVIGPTVADDGVHWRVRARSLQYARPDGALTAALAGRSFDEIARITSARGFDYRGVETWPAWWPRLPVLDSRITIRAQPAVDASGSP